MTKLRFAFLGVVAAASIAVGCELIAGLQDRPLCEAGCVDAPPFEAATNPDFSLAISPPNIVVEPSGPGVPVAITLTRNGGFSEAVAISLTNTPAGVSGSAIIPGNQSTGTLNIFADQTAVPGQVTQVTIAAQSTPSGIVATQPLTVRVGHLLLAATASTTFTVPSDVQNATIATWGAGGSGGGTTTTGPESGGAGGAGGFAEATFAVTPGETLTLIVGKPGLAGSNTASVGYGGGGGGYSAVYRGTIGDGGVDSGTDAAADAGGDAAAAPSPYLVVAGGGGGGGGGFYYTTTPSYSGPGKAGGDGSGANGTDGAGTYGGKGATTTAGGAGGVTCGASGPGSYLQGGNAGTSRSDGGVPGGGYGNSVSGGGGGGGYYGGGSGAGYALATCKGGNGGGGGAGHVEPNGTNPTTTAGTGTTAPSTNHKYYVTGVGAGGAAATAGGPGHVVIYVP